MKVKVKFFGHLRDLIGTKAVVELDLQEGASIKQLLDVLLLDSKVMEILLDERKEIKPDISLLKNGREIKFLKGMDTRLDSGDEISIFPVVVGG
jgi:molybdopterin synthase sulfur carrier subunit